MKIAIITLGVYPITTGGVEIHSYYHAMGLEKSGDEVMVFTKRYRARSTSCVIGRGVRVETLGSSLPVLGQLIFVIQTFAKLLAKRGRIDLVHVHYATYFPLPAYVFHLVTSKPFVVSCHGFDVHGLKESIQWRLVQRMVFKAASVITTASLSIMETLLSKYQLSARKVVCVPNGVDTAEIEEAERSSSDPARDSLVMVANLRPVKDPITAIQAFEIVRGRIPKATMTLVGGGPLYKSIVDYLYKNDLNDAILMKGQLSHAETLRTVASVAVFVLSSIEEGGNPVALMEAMALSKPIVATSVGGVRDVVTDGENGILVPVKSPGALADALVRILSDDSLAKKLSANAKRDSLPFTWDRTVAQYRQIYARITDD